MAHNFTQKSRAPPGSSALPAFNMHLKQSTAHFSPDVVISRGLSGFPGRAGGKGPACQCERHETWVRSPGGEHGNGLQYSCLGNPMDRGAWQTTAHGVTDSQT